MAKVWIVLIAWLTAAAFACWLYELRYAIPARRPSWAKPPSESVGHRTDIQRLASSAGVRDLRGKLVVLHFWADGCACSEFAEGEMRRFAARPGSVQNIAIVEGAKQKRGLEAWSGTGIKFPAVVDESGALAAKYGIWAAPGAVIIDAGERVRYVGGYNTGRFCDTPETAFAFQALEAIERGANPDKSSAPFYGCSVITSR